MRFFLSGLTCALAVSLTTSSTFVSGAILLVVLGFPLASAAAATGRSALTGVAAGIAFGIASGRFLAPVLLPEWLENYYDDDVVDTIAFVVVLGLGLVTAWSLAGRTKWAIAGSTVLGLAVATAYGVAITDHSAGRGYYVHGTVYIYVDPPTTHPGIGIAVAISLILLWIAHRLGGLEAVRWTVLGIGLSPVLSLGTEAVAGALLAGLAGAITGAFLDRTGKRPPPWDAIGAAAVAVGIAYRPLAILVTAGCAFAFSFGFVRAEVALRKIRSDNIIPLALGGAALVAVGTMLRTVPTPALALSALSLISAAAIAVIAVHTWVMHSADQAGTGPSTAGEAGGDPGTAQ